MAGGERGQRGGDGVHRAVLEAGVASAGRTVRPEFGAGPLQPCATRAEAGFRRRRALGEAARSRRTDFELRAGSATAVMAHDDAYQVSVNLRARAAAEPVGSLSGGCAPQAVQLS